MNEPPDSFQDLAARLREGRESAAEQVVREYTNRLIGLARKRLPSDITAKVDPEDVLQSALNSFFERYKDGQFDKVDSRDAFWRLLAQITARRCNRKIDEFFAECRDVRRETNFRGATDFSGPDWDAVAPDPTASEAAILAETEDKLVRESDPKDRPIVELTLKGYSVAEIAERVERSERTVERVRKRLRERLEQMRDKS
jgi:RNA polymerase sigma factor (sigma-70 family)